MPPFDPDSANFITNSEIFVADSAGSPVFRAILSKTVFKLYVHEIHNSKECKKIAMLRMPQTYFRPVEESRIQF